MYQAYACTNKGLKYMLTVIVCYINMHGVTAVDPKTYKLILAKNSTILPSSIDEKTQTDMCKRFSVQGSYKWFDMLPKPINAIIINLTIRWLPGL
ncbi:hypothetical protein PR048_008883 [Dryococelus australis]|uniref:Uncharacterized protein n=1 Tax=Dryococelus australis TaxID=614101 RepID=A0ABQ9HYE0_9NEOP|nr:hypothetical protein PR048_008883 [Dryococelus australis]